MTLAWDRWHTNASSTGLLLQSFDRLRESRRHGCYLVWSHFLKSYTCCLYLMCLNDSFIWFQFSQTSRNSFHSNILWFNSWCFNDENIETLVSNKVRSLPLFSYYLVCILCLLIYWARVFFILIHSWQWPSHCFFETSVFNYVYSRDSRFHIYNDFVSSALRWGSSNIWI